MCGIAGLIRRSEADRTVAVERMTNALSHRGPDDQGIYVDDFVALGHRRLSILDLSSKGHQPMWSADGRYAIVMNAEIYNYESLRGQLRDRGYAFQSQTDTEVALYAYIEWQEECVHRFNGMFALAIYDKEKSRVFIARDRLGIKPFYFAKLDDGSIIFASEVRALVKSGLLKGRLNTGVLASFLRHQTTPTPETILDGVEMLPPGYRMTIDAATVTSDCYWHFLGQASQSSATRDNAQDATKQVRRRLKESIERRLVSDVPLGAFLSGGIDSSLIVGLMSQITDGPLKTFTVSFDDPAYQDGYYAGVVANHFNTDHTEVTLSIDDLLESVPAALAAQDHPSADGINTFIVSKAARKAGLTVALSGLGGDEIFAGYKSFQRWERQQQWQFVWKYLPLGLRKMAGEILARGYPSIATTKFRDLLASDGSLSEGYPIGRQYFSGDIINKFLTQAPDRHDGYISLLKNTFSEFSDVPFLSKVSFAESRTYMHDVLLRDTDQMSMAHALEIRVPMLDHELVEYVTAVDDTIKRPRDIPKRLLVTAFDGFLPDEVVHRPKQGFAMPFDTWMRGPLRDLCTENISVLAARPEFNEATILRTWNLFLNRDRAVSWSRLWLLTALGNWCRTNLEN